MKLLALIVALCSLAFGQSARVAPPLSVKVQLERWSIVVTPHILQTGGYTDSGLHTVFIKAGQDLCDEQDSVLHELFHAVLGVDRSPSMQTLHEWIYDSATPFIDLLRDNPKLVSYLLQPRPPCRSTGR